MGLSLCPKAFTAIYDMVTPFSQPIAEGQRHNPQNPFSHSHYSQHIHSHFFNTTSTVAMAPQRLSRLQRRILIWLKVQYIRTKGTVSPSNQELVAALSDIDKTSISRTLKNLEAKGLISVGRTPGGKAEYLVLTHKP